MFVLVGKEKNKPSKGDDYLFLKFEKREEAVNKAWQLLSATVEKQGILKMPCKITEFKVKYGIYYACADLENGKFYTGYSAYFENEYVVNYTSWEIKEI